MKIAILTDSFFLKTGYQNQAYQLAKYLKSKGHEIHIMMNAYAGSTLKGATLDDGTELPFIMHGELGQSYFANSMSQILKENKIDRFIILLDTFMLFQTNFMNQDTSPAKTFFWFPSDGGMFPDKCENILRKIDCPVAMAKFGQKQVKDYFGINTLHIPHGIDKNRFFKMPQEERSKLRATWGLKDKFVIGVVARNQPRKNLDRTLKTMAILKDRIPNAVLLLHLDPNDHANPMFNILSMAGKLNIENRIVFTGINLINGFPDNRMNEVYNLMDCFLLTTSGEGFGIPIIEAMSCEVPVCATLYTTTQELVVANSAGLGIDLTGTETLDMFKMDMKEYDQKVFNGTMTGSWEVERGFCSITDAADKIYQLYTDPSLRETLGKNGRDAVERYYSFSDHIGPSWEEILK
jgi:glycosyltransferase involved in cell wall biosynthesis